MPPKIPVVELLRVSTADQAEDDRAGLPRQEEANRRTIARHGLDVARRIKLVDVSGACTMAAPEIQEMIRMGRGRPFLTPPKATTFDVRPPFHLR